MTRALVFGPEEAYRLDLQHMVAVYMMNERPAVLAEGETGTISAGGRTFAIMSVGDGRTAAFFGYRTDGSLGELSGGGRPRCRRSTVTWDGWSRRPWTA